MSHKQNISEFTDPNIERISDNIFKLGPLGQPKVLCSYLILDETVSIVDCGPSVVIDELLQLVAKCSVHPSDIDNLLLTHIHLDHAGGTARFAEKCPKAEIYVPARGFKHLIDPTILNPSARVVLGSELFDYWGAAAPAPKSRVHSMEKDSALDLGSQDVRYMEARGHAPHHDVLLLEKSRTLFAADALGLHDDRNGDFHSPTTPPPSFNLDQQLKDFDMIKNLRTTLICLAHFKALKPTDDFFANTLDLYENWERIIGGYLKDNEIRGSSLSATDIESIYSILKTEYPAYGALPKALEHQVKRVDITGFAQWFDFKANREDLFQKH